LIFRGWIGKKNIYIDVDFSENKSNLFLAMKKKKTYWSPISTHPSSKYTLYENKKLTYGNAITKR
jgi:hypothetical protein